MNNNKQSSVDWLAEQLTAKMQMWNSTKNYQEFHIVLEAGEFANLIEQAKSMHKEENRETWDECLLGSNPEKTFEDHYNEKFGGNK